MEMIACSFQDANLRECECVLAVAMLSFVQ